MTPIRFTALDSALATHYRNGGEDAHGQTAQTMISEGGAPCRHCLADVEPGASMLVLAHCPFPSRQPYAEVGLIFVHAHACPRYEEKGRLPPVFLARKEVVLRGYDGQHRMVYDTAQRIATAELITTAARLLARPDVLELHVRGTVTTCFQCRIQRVE